MRHYLAPVLLAILALGGCGSKGNLTLPPKPAAVGKPVPASANGPESKAMPPNADDSSTPGGAAR